MHAGLLVIYPLVLLHTCFDPVIAVHLQAPWAETHPTQIQKMVLAQQRPNLPLDACFGAAALIQLCWLHKPAKRPSMAAVFEELLHVGAVYCFFVSVQIYKVCVITLGTREELLLSVCPECLTVSRASMPYMSTQTSAWDTVVGKPHRRGGPCERSEAQSSLWLTTSPEFCTGRHNR